MDVSTSPRPPRARTSHRLPALLALLAALVVALTASTGASPAGAAIGDAPCPPSPIWVVDNGSAGDGGATLIQHAPDGTVLSTVTLVDAGGADLSHAVGDIAWSTDASTLYSVPFGAFFGDEVPFLRSHDAVTGVQTSEVTITGIDPSDLTARMNALTAAPDGSLYLGIYADPQIYKVDPATGVATLFAELPAGVGSSGDFLTLADGSIIAFGDEGVTSSDDVSHVYRISPDGSTVTWVGDVSRSFGAAQSGGDLYLLGHFGSELQRLAIADIPLTVGTDPALPTTTVATAPDGRWLNGATSVQDASGCAASYEVTKTVAPDGAAEMGSVLTYTITVTNTSDVAYTSAAPASLSDDLADVLDDALLDHSSVSASSGTVSVSGSTLSWEGALAPQGSAGDSVTITYDVWAIGTSTGELTGDDVARNSVEPTGFGGVCGAAGCATEVILTAAVDPIGDWAVTKVADTPVVPPGGVVTYTVTVENLNAAASSVVLSDVLTATPGSTITDVTVDNGTATHDGAAIEWSVVDLAPGAIATMTTTVAVGPTATGLLTNVATVDPTSPCEAPHCATAEVEVISDPGVPLVSLPILIGAGALSGGLIVRRRLRSPIG